MPQRTDEPDPQKPADWISFPAAALALGVTTGQARRIATSKKWRQLPNSRPTQIAFADVLATYRDRTHQEPSP